MKITLFYLAVIFALLFSNQTQAQLFSQDFSSSSNVADYVSAMPNNGQFNSISSTGTGTTVSIESGTLQYARTTASGSAAAFSRTTDFSPTPTAIRYKVDITVSGNSTATTSAAQFLLGSNLAANNTVDATTEIYARFAINLSSMTGCFFVRDITNGNTNSTQFCGTQTITWIVNNTTNSLDYIAPDNSTQTVTSDTVDIYVGNLLVFDNVGVQTPTQSITDIKFVNNLGISTIQLDNLNIVSLAPLSAPASIGGRVTDAAGRGIAFAFVSVTGGNLKEPVTVFTDSYGYYVFPELEVGETYVIQVMSKRHSFAEPSRVYSLLGNVEDADFVGSLW